MKSVKKSKTRSESLKKAHAEGRHPGWRASNYNNRSYPEKLFYKVLNEDFTYFNKYTIEEQFTFKKYCLDFALLELKCDIEIDGIQHYRTEKARRRDKERDEFIISQGWSVYRISAKLLKEDPHREINKLIEFLKTKSKFGSYDPDEVLKSFQPEKVYGSMEAYTNARRKQYLEKYKPVIEKLLNSDIDFSKYGWVNEAAEIIGIRNPKVAKWMRKYMPEFYKEHCFKRK